MSEPTGLCECGCGETTRVASRTDAVKGWTKGEHLRFAGPGHNASVTNRPHRQITADDYSIEARGFATECWIWARRVDELGYAMVMVNRVRTMAHRAVYIQEVGEIPSGYSLHHLCEQPSCVNPEHLLPLTNAQHLSLHRRAALGHLPRETLARRDEILANLLA